MFEQGCEQVSNLVSIIVYEQVQEAVSKHKCEQVSKSEPVSIIVWLIEKNEKWAYLNKERVH